MLDVGVAVLCGDCSAQNTAAQESVWSRRGGVSRVLTREGIRGSRVSLAVFRAFPINAASSLPPPRVILFSWLEAALCLLELVCGLASEVLVVRPPEGKLLRSLLVGTNLFG